MLVLGDAHASTPDRRAALLAAFRAVSDPTGPGEASTGTRHESDREVALHVGDLEHYDLPLPTWFVAGNNEEFDVIDALRDRAPGDGGSQSSLGAWTGSGDGVDHDGGRDGADGVDGEAGGNVDEADAADGEAGGNDGESAESDPRLENVRNVNLLASTAADVAGLRVAGLSGNFAPTRYDSARSDLQGERRRHFTRDEVERAAALEDVDLFLAHEPPTGLYYEGYDPGCDHVRALIQALDPDLCLVGHHHRHREAEIAGVRTVGLAPVWERYYTLDPETLALSRHETPVDAGSPD